MTNNTYSKKYQVTNEVLNALTHGIACLLSVIGLILLLAKGFSLDSPVYVAAYAIFGASMILLFLFSTLYHSFSFTRFKSLFQIFDHNSIFLLIAGSYTPFCLLTIQGPMGIALVVTIWALALFGIVYTSICINKHPRLALALYLIMGWLCIIAAYQLYANLGMAGFMLLLLGGVSYSVGSIFYKMKNVKYMHVVWHLFVMLGAGFIFMSIYMYT